MCTYSQPDFYHFAEDSILLAQIASEYSQNLSAFTVVDYFAGCGVVGLEFLRRSNQVEEVHLVESSSEFHLHFLHNLDLIDEEKRKRVFWHLEDCFSPGSQLGAKQFDIILANPPFFDMESNRKAQGEDGNRQRCRSWDALARQQFCLLLKTKLTLLGRAFILLRSDQQMLHLLQQEKTLSILTRREIGKNLILEICLNIDGNQ